MLKVTAVGMNYASPSLDDKYKKAFVYAIKNPQGYTSDFVMNNTKEMYDSFRSVGMFEHIGYAPKGETYKISKFCDSFAQICFPKEYRKVVQANKLAAVKQFVKNTVIALKKIIHR